MKWIEDIYKKKFAENLPTDHLDKDGLWDLIEQDLEERPAAAWPIKSIPWIILSLSVGFALVTYMTWPDHVDESKTINKASTPLQTSKEGLKTHASIDQEIHPLTDSNDPAVKTLQSEKVVDNSTVTSTIKNKPSVKRLSFQTENANKTNANNQSDPLDYSINNSETKELNKSSGYINNPEYDESNIKASRSNNVKNRGDVERKQISFTSDKTNTKKIHTVHTEIAVDNNQDVLTNLSIERIPLTVKSLERNNIGLSISSFPRQAYKRGEVQRSIGSFRLGSIQAAQDARLSSNLADGEVIRRFHLITGLGLNRSKASFQSTTLDENLLSDINSAQETEWGFHFDLKLRYLITDRFYVQPGLSYYRQFQRFSFNNTYNDFITRPDGRAGMVDATITRNVFHYNDLKSLIIPLQVGYRMPIGKLDVSLAAGPRLGIITAAQGKILTNSNEITSYDRTGYLNRTTGIGYQLDAALYYALTEDFGIGATLQWDRLRYGSLQLIDADLSIQTLSGTIGFRYRL